MKKTLLFLFALLMSASFSFAATPNPSNPDLLAQGMNNFWNGGTYNEETQTVTLESWSQGAGWGFWDNKDFSAYKTFTLEFEPVDFTVQITVQYDGTAPEKKEQVDGKEGKMVMTFDSPTVSQIVIQYGGGDLKLTAAYLSGDKEEPSFVETGKVYLSQFDGYADDAIATITINVTNEGGWGPGWGIGRITDIAYAKDNTKFATIGIDVKASSEEGTLNSYDFTVSELKAMASISPADLEELKESSGKEFGTEWTVNDENYIVNDAGEIGLVVNIWGSGTRVSITIKDATPSAVLDFESDEAGQEYPIISINEGAAPDDATAIVEERPEGEGKALHIINERWNTYPQFFVTFPEGKTLANIEKITFEIYFESVESVGEQQPNSYKEFRYFFGTKGTTFTQAGQSTGYIITGPSANPGKTWLKKEFVPSIDESLLSLNAFEFGLGLHINEAGNYFLDNITFVFKDETGLIKVEPVESKIYFANGGIGVRANNEKVLIYGIDGRLVKQTIVGYDTVISLSQGIYIVKIGAAAPVKALVK